MYTTKHTQNYDVKERFNYLADKICVKFNKRLLVDGSEYHNAKPYFS